MQTAQRSGGNIADNNHDLTVRLLKTIDALHREPRSRPKLIRTRISGIERLSPASEGGLPYLLTGLAILRGEHPQDPESWVPAEQVNLFLRTAEDFGISLHYYRIGRTVRWGEIGLNFKQQIRGEWTRGLRFHFPALRGGLAVRVTDHLLGHGLARVLPPFTFGPESRSVPVMLVRPQADLHWEIITAQESFLATLYTHFPKLDWKGTPVGTRGVWFWGVRFLSPPTTQAAQLLGQSLSGLDYSSTSHGVGRRRVLALAFYSRRDLDLFCFNLTHLSKRSGVHHELFPGTLDLFRRGYPGLTGIFQEPWAREVAFKAVGQEEP